jgi:hypothetical protein
MERPDTDVDAAIVARKLVGQWPAPETLRILDALVARSAALKATGPGSAPALIFGSAGAGLLLGAGGLFFVDDEAAFIGGAFGFVLGLIGGAIAHGARKRAHARKLARSGVGEEVGTFVAPLLRVLAPDLRPGAPIELELELASGREPAGGPSGSAADALERTLAQIRLRLDDGNRLALRISESIAVSHREKHGRVSRKYKGTKESARTSLETDLRLQVNGERYRAAPGIEQRVPGLAAEERDDGLLLRLRVSERSKAKYTFDETLAPPYPVPAPDRTLAAIVALYSCLTPATRAAKEG